MTIDQSNQRAPALITPVQKKMVRGKLGQVYGIHLSGRAAGVDVLAHHVASVLKVPNPVDLAESTEMLLAFIGAGFRGIAADVPRREFRPYVQSREMEEALRRTAEFRAIAPSSGGSIHRDRKA